jgi:hypothetical protein
VTQDTRSRTTHAEAHLCKVLSETLVLEVERGVVLYLGGISLRFGSAILWRRFFVRRSLYFPAK